MMRAVRSAQLNGLEAEPVTVEVDARNGLPAFSVVGLAHAAVRESRDRVLTALRNAGFESPACHVTVNLAPASLKKVSALLDLPISVGLLCASGMIEYDIPRDLVFLGELSLAGAVRPASGILAMLDALLAAGSSVCIPADNLPEAAILAATPALRRRVRGIRSLADLRLPVSEWPAPSRRARKKSSAAQAPDFADVRGQFLARRAAEIAAAGGHHMLLIGPPGTGKSMIARRMPSILPGMDRREALDVTKIYSVAGMLASSQLIEVRPYRAPHHTVSDAALVGGGPMALPGELTLAHAGVLFMDEFPEFKRNCLEAMRQPLEDRIVSVSRAAAKVTYPAAIQLIAAMNPCPCGYLHHPSRPCRCRASDVQRYLNRVSGPLVDRMDLHVMMAVEPPDTWMSGPGGEPSSVIRERVLKARGRQSQRLGSGRINAHLNSTRLRETCRLAPDAQAALEKAVRRMSLSPRSMEKVIKVARTIADLDSSDTLQAAHVLEAIQYRGLDLLTTQSL